MLITSTHGSQIIVPLILRIVEKDQQDQGYDIQAHMES